MKEYCACSDVTQIVSYDDRYNTKNTILTFYTRNHSEIKAICEKFYAKDRKRVSKEILNELTPFSIAYWFMDDGLTDINKNGKTREFCSLGSSKLYTCSFSMEENLLIKEWFKEKFNIECFIRFKKKPSSSPYLFFYTREAEKLRELIEPYVIEGMKYKVDYKCAVERYLRDNSQFELTKMPGKKSYIRLKDKDKKQCVDIIFDYYRKLGFPDIVLDEESIRISFDRILNWKHKDLYHDEKSTIKTNSNSINLVHHFQKHIFDMCFTGGLTTHEVFNDDILLRSSIEKCLIEVGACSQENLISVIKQNNNGDGITNMLPSVAKALYMRFDKKMSILDLFAGFGGRLLSAMASDNIIRYVGIDSLKQNCLGLNQMIEKFKEKAYPSVNIINGEQENVINDIDEKFDIILLFPFFFEKELLLEKNEVLNRYSDELSWNAWILSIIEKSLLRLNESGKFIIGIDTDNDKIKEGLYSLLNNLLSLDEVIVVKPNEKRYEREKNDYCRLNKFLIMSRK